MNRKNLLALASAVLLAGSSVYAATESTSWGKIKKDVVGDTEPAAKKTAPAQKPQKMSNKVDICHFDADTELFHVINISSNAVDNHLANHGDSAPSTYYADQDGDGYGDAATTDACPNPGFVDNSDDAFPTDATEHADSDGDGVGDNADLDDDNDGVADSEDAFPLDASESVDTDGDGIGNNADLDDDGDGVADSEDAFPLDPSESVDTDGDGIGDNSDPTPNGEPVFGFVEFDFNNVGITTGPCPDCVLSAPASSSDGPIASASFEWTDTDGISPGCGCSVHGVLDWGSNMFVGRGLGDPSTYGGEYYYLDLNVSAAVQLTNISLLVGNNGFYTNPVNVVAFQAGQETVLGTFNLPGAASPAANTPPNVTVAIAGQLDPGPAQIRLKVQGGLFAPWDPCGYNAFVYVDDIHVDFQY